MSLEVTYRLLTESERPEAIEVLRRGLEVDDQETRHRCLRTLARRACRGSHEILVAYWAEHADDMRHALPKDEAQLFEASVIQIAQEDLKVEHSQLEGTALEDRVRTLTQIIVVFSIRHAMPTLVDAAWQHPSHVVRQLCVDAVMSLAHPWGSAARRQYVGTTHDPSFERLRHEIASQLLVCVQNFQRHRSEQLLDAFLILSSWSDSVLRAALTTDDVACSLVMRRLRSSSQQPVMELLAGFIQRRSIPERILPLVLQRSDAMYRETLLQLIASEPTSTTIANLCEYGLPDSLRGGVGLLRTLGTDRDAALAHAYSSAMQQDPETIHLLLDILDRHPEHGSQTEPVADAVATSLARCRVPTLDYWRQALSSDRTDDPAGGPNVSSSSHRGDRAAELCTRLVRLAGSEDVRFSKLASRLLSELKIENALPLFETLDEKHRARLGRILMQVDSATLDVVRDGLRHAVMRRRLEAIEFAQTLGLVDVLLEPFGAIVRSDHQTARLAAAEALGTGVSESSAALLRELTNSPMGSLREAAKASLSRRGIKV